MNISFRGIAFTVIVLAFLVVILRFIFVHDEEADYKTGMLIIKTIIIMCSLCGLLEQIHYLNFNNNN